MRKFRVCFIWEKGQKHCTDSIFSIEKIGVGQILKRNMHHAAFHRKSYLSVSMPQKKGWHFIFQIAVEGICYTQQTQYFYNLLQTSLAKLQPHLAVDSTQKCQFYILHVKIKGIWSHGFSCFVCYITSLFSIMLPPWLFICML